MNPPVVTKDPTAVEVEVQATHQALFPGSDHLFVPRVFGWAIECFLGGYKDYQPVDASYHDFEHTLQGTLCMTRLLWGRQKAGALPPLTQRMYQLGVLAILFHDTGYLKKRNDRDGTGAKYTITHVGRSIEFAAELLQEKGFSARDIRSVQNMIRCTGVDAVLDSIPFHDEIERVTGLALGTADLLGQMAAADYVDKLPTLYEEFAEAARFSKNSRHFVATFKSASDLISKTPEFWEKHVLVKLDRDFGGLYRFLNDPHPDGPNSYFDRVEANMQRLREKGQR
jgi:hypothetical protein